MGKMIITGQHKHLSIVVEKGIIHVHVFFRKYELKRVRVRFDAVRFYVWLGRELGVRDAAHHADLQGLREEKTCTTTSSESDSTETSVQEHQHTTET